VILGDAGPVLLVDARSAYLLRDAVRRWLAEHQRHGARQKTAAVLPLLEEWERVADAYAQALSASASGPATSTDTCISVTVTADRICTTAAALELNVSPRQVRRLIASGDLPAQTVGRSKVLDPADVEALKDLRSTA
jgi:hypothetical protein